MIDRNSPTLLYAGFQHLQFWEGRAKNLEEQISMVIKSPSEMQGNETLILELLRGKKTYHELFKNAYPGVHGDSLSMEHISASIACFVRSLGPMTAAFDRYIAGDKSALSKAEKNGFNLFMGKAQCGTCHFAPLFNGLLPPFYDRTEVEVIATTENEDFDHPVQDKDKGRYTVFPIEFYEGAFKTPTVRNSALTAPYMHNGAFSTLEKVVEFYNRGGGAGLGLNIPNQTLSSKPLHLNDNEASDLVKFLTALSDSLPVGNARNKTTIKNKLINIK
jgi:cytochrome c peroxidase